MGCSWGSLHVSRNAAQTFFFTFPPLPYYKYKSLFAFFKKYINTFNCKCRNKILLNRVVNYSCIFIYLSVLLILDWSVSFAWLQCDLSICRWQLWGNTGSWSFYILPQQIDRSTATLQALPAGLCLGKTMSGTEKVFWSCTIQAKLSQSCSVCCWRITDTEKGAIYLFPSLCFNISMSRCAGGAHELSHDRGAGDLLTRLCLQISECSEPGPASQPLQMLPVQRTGLWALGRPLEHNSEHCWMSWELRGLELCWLHHTAHPQCWCKDPDTHTHTHTSKPRRV